MTDANERLLKSVAVVTGAGSGLGRALAQGLAARGVRVAAFGRRLEPLQETAAGHAGILPIACDVSDPLALTEAFAQVRAELGLRLALTDVKVRRPPARGPGQRPHSRAGHSVDAVVRGLPQTLHTQSRGPALYACAV